MNGLLIVGALGMLLLYCMMLSYRGTVRHKRAEVARFMLNQRIGQLDGSLTLMQLEQAAK